MINFVAPIRSKAQDLFLNKKYLQEVMEQGAAKARQSAKSTMEIVRHSMGFNY